MDSGSIRYISPLGREICISASIGRYVDSLINSVSRPISVISCSLDERIDNFLSESTRKFVIIFKRLR